MQSLYKEIKSHSILCRNYKERDLMSKKLEQVVSFHIDNSIHGNSTVVLQANICITLKLQSRCYGYNNIVWFLVLGYSIGYLHNAQYN